jgi:integrase
MPRMRFTEENIAQLPTPAQGKVEYSDREYKRLVFRINAGQQRSWCVLDYIKRDGPDGKRLKAHPTTKKLGDWPHLSLKEAWKQCMEYCSPSGVQKRKDEEQARQQQERERGENFRSVAEQWVLDHVDGSKLRSKRERVRHLTKYVYPHWQDRPITALRRKDVHALLDHIAVNHGRMQADAVLTTIRGVMLWYSDRDEDFQLPLGHHMKRDKRRPEERARERILNDDEIRALWQACDRLGRYGDYLKFLLLSAQRRTKVAAIKWSDLDRNGVWTLPKENREKGHIGQVRLPPAALQLLRSQPRLDGNPYIFPGLRRRDDEIGAFTAFHELKRAVDKQLPPDMPPWVLHDLRRTARSLLARIGVDRHVAERLLGHRLRGVEAIYNQHAYTVEKTQALAKLAAAVARIVKPQRPRRARARRAR